MNGKLMKERREELGMTQMQLAVAVGASSVTQVSNWERGRTLASVPKLGHLHEAGEEVVLQTSRQVLNPKTRGNAAWAVDWLMNRRQFYLGQGLVTNEHERSAFAHGWYYLHTGEGAPNEEG